MQPGAIRRGVIVADDSIIIRDNVRVALGEPWHIFLAVDGVEAVEFARGVTAELVLLDFQMPRMDGLDTCALIRNLPNYGSVPIVLLTAYDSVDLRRRAGHAGATAVFPKPFSANALRAGVLPLIALGRDAARAPGPSGLSAAPPPAPDAEASGELEAGRDILAVYRKVEAAIDPRRYASFVEIMAARHMKARR
jgi:CheY-like chemotaxis protein